jgi:DNA-binding transcriptional MerR regulator
MERVWMKIGEAAKRVGVKPKDLRYWESIIPEIQPRRSRGNLRYYHVDELDRLLRIHGWLKEGLTVGDCRQLLLTGQLARGLDLGLDEVEAAPAAQPVRAPRRPVQTAPKAPGLAKVRAALKRLLAQLGGGDGEGLDKMP